MGWVRVTTSQPIPVLESRRASLIESAFSAYVIFFLDVVQCALLCARLFVLSLLFHLC